MLLLFTGMDDFRLVDRVVDWDGLAVDDDTMVLEIQLDFMSSEEWCAQNGVISVDIDNVKVILFLSR